MLTRLEKAFFKKEVSPTLISLWEKNEGKDVQKWVETRRNFWLGLFVSLFLIWAFYSVAVYQLKTGGSLKHLDWETGTFFLLGGVVCMVPFGTSLLLLHEMLFEIRHDLSKILPDKRFFRDCYELKLTFDPSCLGYQVTVEQNEEGLRRLAKEMLVRRAQETIRHEREHGRTSPFAEASRRYFKGEHLIFGKFGLVEAEHTSYFRIAEKNLEREKGSEKPAAEEV